MTEFSNNKVLQALWGLASVDKALWENRFQEGAQALNLALPAQAVDNLERFAATLLKWNRKVNLTAITDPLEVLEKHMLDSLAVLLFLGSPKTLIDVGAGAGFPGVALAVAQPGLALIAIDSVGKKVQFIKQIIAELRLAPRVQARHLRVEGNPAAEQLQPAEAVICRALMDLEPWCALAKHYVLPGGRVFAMLGKAPPVARVEALRLEHGYVASSLHTYRLPWSGAERSLAVFTR